MSTTTQTFQDVKDSFYIALRDRLAKLNPDRTVVVRGTTRPAVLVAENEQEPGVQGSVPHNAFVLHWGPSSVDASEALPLMHGRCSIQVVTAGSPELAGMDRGRVLAAMRTELAAMLRPASAARSSYAGTTPVAAIGPVFWSALTDEVVKEEGGTLRFTCAVDVFAWKEGA